MRIRLDAYPSAGYARPIEVLPLPTITATDVPRCNPGAVQLNATASPSVFNTPPSSLTGIMRMFAASTGGSAIQTLGGSSGAFTTPSISVPTTYYLEYEYTESQGTGEPGSVKTCVSPARTAVVATANSLATLSSFTPTAGAPGSVITLNGNNLSNVISVKFGSVPAPDFSIFSNTAIATRVPAGATSTQITVIKAACAPVTSSSVFTVPVATSADLAWRWQRRAATSGQAYFYKTRTAPSGDHYAAGSFFQQTTLNGGVSDLTLTSPSLAGLLVKYNKAGARQWVCQIGNTGGGGAEVVGLAVDKFGYAYVSGYFFGTINVNPSGTGTATLTSAGGRDMFVAKVHPNGNLVWAFRMGSTGDDIAYGVDVAPDLRFYVAGSFVGTTNIVGLSGTNIPLTSRGNSDAFLAKFSDLGTLYWAIQAGGPLNDFGYGAAADKTGGGYLMGSYEGTATFNSSLGGTTPISKTVVGGSDGFVLGVSVTGQLSWVASMGGSTNENVRDVAPDPRGTGLVAVGGFSGTSTFGSLGSLTAIGFYDAFAVRLSNTGAFEWVKRMGGFGQDQAWAVRLDRLGNPLVGVYFSSQARNFGSANNDFTTYGGIDAAIVRLDAATGNPNWRTQVTGENGDEIIYGIDTTAQGGAVASGGRRSTYARFGLLTDYSETAGNSVGWIARYSTASSASREGEEEATLGALAAGSQLALWPNPASGNFSLKVLSDPGLSPEGSATIALYATDGRLALSRTAPLSELTRGFAVSANLPHGIYTVRVVEASGKTHHGRLALQ